MLQRRHFIKSSGLLGLSTMLGATNACTTSTGALKYADKNFNISSFKKFPKLDISMDRVIKETVGLRPFRASGPRIEDQKIGNKTIVHNYGHGGSGWSLSWGTASIACELALMTGEEKFAIIGGGAIGLATARLLQRKGYETTIYTKDLHPKITSSMATGTWSPSYLFCDEDKVSPELKSLWNRAVKFSYGIFQDTLGLDDVVTWIDHFVIHNEFPSKPKSGSLTDQMPSPPPVLLNNKEHPFAAEFVSVQPQLLFNIPSYIHKLMTDYLRFGGQIQIRAFDTVEDILSLNEKVVMNCTGLGAKKLFNDDELMPISGQLSTLVPQESINFRLSTPHGYFIPRKDGIVLGGNAIKNNWDTTPDPIQTEKVVTHFQEIMDRIKT